MIDAAEIARLKEIASNACNEKWGVAGPSFIAAFSPPTVLSLLTALEQSQDVLDYESAMREARTETVNKARSERDAPFMGCLTVAIGTTEHMPSCTATEVR